MVDDTAHEGVEVKPNVLMITKFLLFIVIICLLSINNAFLPSSKANPNVNANKNINIIAKPYASFVYALTRYG